MESSANSGGRLDASGTTLYLSRTRQGVSTISKERPYWLTQQSQHEMRERQSSMNAKTTLSKGSWIQLNERQAARTGLLLLLLLLALPAVVQAQFTYTTTNGTITITGYTGPGGWVTIPSTINGLPVTSIGDYAFAILLSSPSPP